MDLQIREDGRGEDIVFDKRLEADVLALFVEMEDLHGTLMGVDDPIFADPRFLIDFVFVLHFPFGVAGRDDFDYQIGCVFHQPNFLSFCIGKRTTDLIEKTDSFGVLQKYPYFCPTFHQNNLTIWDWFTQTSKSPT